jgi:hypothetical protein
LFPAYQTALANLPEEPTPLLLPALKDTFFTMEDMDDDYDEHQTAEGAASDPQGVQLQVPPEEANAMAHPAAAQVPPGTPVIPPAGATPAPTVQQTAARPDRQAVMDAFLQAPNIRDPTNLPLGEIAILLHFLIDSPAQDIALSRLIPPLSPLEGQAIWEAWAPHFYVPGYVRDFFCGVLEGSPKNVEERISVISQIQDRVHSYISEATLRAYTKGAIEEEAMPQCSSASKRGRNDADDMSDTGASSRQLPKGSKPSLTPTLPRA